VVVTQHRVFRAALANVGHDDPTAVTDLVERAKQVTQIDQTIIQRRPLAMPRVDQQPVGIPHILQMHVRDVVAQHAESNSIVLVALDDHVAGVIDAADVARIELREQADSELYFSAYQDMWPRMSLVVRASVDPESLGGAVRNVVNEVDKSIPVSQVQTMEHVVSASITQPRFNLFLLGLFSTVAMLLSAAGIYGVTAYTVTQRTHELGIRLALGAQVGDVLKMIVSQGMAVIVVGLVLGLGSAFALMRLLRSLLFGVGENDPVTFVAITVLLFVVALLACYIPARRATKVDPLTALRAE